MSYKLPFVVINDPTQRRMIQETIQDKCKTSNTTAGFYDRIKKKASKFYFTFPKNQLQWYCLGMRSYQHAMYVSNEMQNLYMTTKAI